MFSAADERRGGSLDGEELGGGDSVLSILGSDVTITGDVIGSGELQIEGTIVGNIKGRALTLGETSSVEGSIEADEVRLAGSLTGNVSAASVALLQSAKMTGDITQQSLAMEPGAAFSGQVRKRP